MYSWKKRSKSEKSERWQFYFPFSDPRVSRWRLMMDDEMTRHGCGWRWVFGDVRWVFYVRVSETAAALNVVDDYSFCLHRSLHVAPKYKTRKAFSSTVARRFASSAGSLRRVTLSHARRAIVFLDKKRKKALKRKRKKQTFSRVHLKGTERAFDCSILSSRPFRSSCAPLWLTFLLLAVASPA